MDDDVVVINDYLDAEGFTDGLPVIPPIANRVQAMAEASGRRASHLVATIPPAQGRATVEKIAINAVMAGCRPEYMPVVVAAIEAMAQPGFNLGVCQVTTHPAAPMLVVNGPVRAALSINSGTNALGQGARANATIGRAIRLTLTNLGGATPGTVDKSTQGQPARYTFCFGECEEETPWEPLHAERGVPAEESAVTVVSAAGTHHLANGGDRGEDVLKSLAYGIICSANNHMTVPSGEPMLLLNPTHARLIAAAGYTKDQVKQHLFELARVPVEWISEYTLKRRRQAGIPPDGGSVPITERWENFMVAVVGGDGGLHSTYIPTIGPSKAQTRRIQPGPR